MGSPPKLSVEHKTVPDLHVICRQLVCAPKKTLADDPDGIMQFAFSAEHVMAPRVASVVLVGNAGHA
jgi:hypothetical protein